VEQFGKEGKILRRLRPACHHAGAPHDRSWAGGRVPREVRHGVGRRAYWMNPLTNTGGGPRAEDIPPHAPPLALFRLGKTSSSYDFFADGHVDENVFVYSNRAGDARGLVIYNNRYGIRPAGYAPPPPGG